MILKKTISFGLLSLMFCLAKAQEYASISFSDKVIHSFSQGGGPAVNNAAISLIKCAIATYGTTDVLKKIESRVDGYHITLRNNDTITLLKSELAFVKSKCGFKLRGEEQIFDKSVFLYAIMAKRAMHHPGTIFSSCKNMQIAISFLHTGSRMFRVVDLVDLLGFNYFEVRAHSEICYIHQDGVRAAFACYKNFDDDGIKRRFDKQNGTARIRQDQLNFILVNFIPENSPQSLKSK